jgi:predicted ATPase/DNA-binding CsgD family transcriptional regulator
LRARAALGLSDLERRRRVDGAHNLVVANRWVVSEVDVSAREADVLAALGEHLTNAEIGARLFISIRTVESHVSSLLRKLQVSDRRALAALAATLRVAPVTGNERAETAAVAQLPSPLTSFVGRVAERAALIDALEAHRLVTAIGPGGVGKTRLALSVAAEVTERFADGAWFVDLVPVTDPAMIASTIATALGLGEHQGRSAQDTVLGWLAARETLLVLDNCEHLVDGVVALLERVLAGSPRVSVLATSRARLLVPFEWVFAVPGLSLAADDGGLGDAVELFLSRSAAGGSLLTPEDTPRIAAVCERLDGMALAIELAAARVPSLGLDGIEAGLADRLRLLTGGGRVGDRQRSLRSLLDWSYALLEEPDRAVLRRVSVFATAFTPAAAAVVAGWPPVAGEAVPIALAGLADQSLLVAIADPAGTRYRALETIRQYGLDRLDDVGESVAASSRHLSWCLDAGTALEADAREDVSGWRPAFDQIADELRRALGWAADTAQYRPEAHRMAIVLADLSFARGTLGESQQRYEQAVELAPDGKAATNALRCAAGAAESRNFGTEALRLRRAAADAAIRSGNRAVAAEDLARAAELINRAPGIMATRPGDGEVKELLAQGWALAADDASAQARLLTAEAFRGNEFDPLTAELVDRALTLARRVGDPLTESAALDQLTAVQLARGEVRAATASALQRLDLLAAIPVTPLSGLEFADAHGMAAECSVAVGDLLGARRLAERARDLPFHREEGHLATARLIVVAALAGDWDETIALAERFREGWERAGRQRAGVFSRAAYAAATVHGLRGDDIARAEWLDIVDALVTPGRLLSDFHFGEFFDALLLLHRGQSGQAVRLLDTPPKDLRAWNSGMWRPWYAALWAEAAVLTEHEDADDRLLQARLMTVDNPIAAAIVHRAAALAGDHDELIPAAAALRAAGCRYQWARTLVYIGGEHRTRGESVLAAMGATPMARHTGRR